MPEWVAISYGALDMRNRDDRGDYEMLLLPVVPSTPLGIAGEVAELWRRLVAEPVGEDELTDDERALVREFEDVGIASQDLEHPARTRTVDEPWLVSPMHELVNSLVISLARETGVDLLIMKGPVLRRQGIRDRVHSGDVDAWVRHGQMQAIEGALARWGWEHQEGLWEGTEARHSVTMDRGSWGCQIDLHRSFPGIGAKDQLAFQLLCENAEEVRFASVAGSCPEPATHAVIQALHVLRPGASSALADGNMPAAVTALTRGGPDVIERARVLGAMAALDPALREAFPERVFPDPGPVPANWAWRTKTNRLAAHLSALRMLPWRQRPKYFLRVFWPTDEVAIQSEIRAGGSERRPARAKLKRLVRGAGALVTRARPRRRG